MPNPADNLDDDFSITELGRAILKYMHARMEDMGFKNSAYRKIRLDLLHRFSGPASGHFNWGFETVFSQEIHTLEKAGLLLVKYGSGAIMAGRVGKNQIYNIALTSDGIETAKVIIEREGAFDFKALEQRKEDEGEAEESTAGEVESSTHLRPSPGAEFAKDATAPAAPPDTAASAPADAPSHGPDKVSNTETNRETLLRQRQDLLKTPSPAAADAPAPGDAAPPEAPAPQT